MVGVESDLVVFSLSGEKSLIFYMVLLSAFPSGTPIPCTEKNLDSFLKHFYGFMRFLLKLPLFNILINGITIYQVF